MACSSGSHSSRSCHSVASFGWQLATCNMRHATFACWLLEDVPIDNMLMPSLKCSTQIASHTQTYPISVDKPWPPSSLWLRPVNRHRQTRLSYASDGTRKTHPSHSPSPCISGETCVLPATDVKAIEKAGKVLVACLLTWCASVYVGNTPNITLGCINHES